MDRKNCAAINGSSLQLYFAQDRTVWKMNGKGENSKLVANTTGASGLDFHYNRNLLFWSDIKTRKVYMLYNIL